MLRPALAVSALLLAGALLPVVAAPKVSNTSARVVFADQSPLGSPARIRSDRTPPDDPAYVDGTDCVQAWYAPKANFFMRTVTSALPACGPTVAVRALVLDFSDRVWPVVGCPGPGLVYAYDANNRPLDICGPNDVPDARLVADRLFSATATKLDIPFSLEPDFRNTAFELNYVETLAVSAVGSGRAMTAGPGALAELYATSGRTKTLLGRYRMPAQITVTAAAAP